MKGLITLVGAVSVLMAALAVAGEPDRTVEKAARPRVEVVFVLDTTGSMGGLLQGAKEKVWAIANTLATARPTPQVKMGLVGYRDRGDAYVTKLTDLTDDLDAVYKDLMEFQADQGGDTPESVNQALHDAVHKIKWSNDATTYRVIYLVGDCPPHMDYKDDVKYPDTCKAAAAAGIVINTIQCGGQADTTPVWQDIANRAEGACFRVEQSGGAVTVATPFDEEMAKVSVAMDGTRVYYGTAVEREEKEGRARASAEMAVTAPAAAMADRAAFKGKAGLAASDARQELITEVADGTVKLEQLDEKALPEEMQKMTPDQRKAYVADQVKKRKELQEKIEKLGAQRREFIEKKMRESGAGAKDSFDKAILKSVQEQAAKKGIVYEETGGEKAE